MRPQILTNTLKARITAHNNGQTVRPTNIVASPGVGKTQIAQAAAKELGIGLMSLHGPLMLAEDFGMPRFQDGELTFATPGHKFPFVDTDCADTGIVVVDELAQMDIPQQKIAANMFQERELHGRKLKPGWHFVTTGNRQSDRAGANRILSHLNDRVTTYELEVHLEDWVGWALDNGVRPEVISFLQFRSDLLNNFDPAQDKSPTPRSWAEGVSRSIDLVPAEAEFDTFKGDVGEGAAAEFTGFLRIYRDLPDPEMVIANPKTAVVPTENNVRYALCGALSHRANKGNVGAVLEYAQRLPAEFTVLLARDMTRMHKDLYTAPEFMAWATKGGFDILTGR